MPGPQHRRDRRGRGFEMAAGLLTTRIRKAGEGRGFAVARLLTHWDEIAGADVAALARPVKVGYGREGMGATLTLLCTGAAAPLVQMRLEEIREKVNACYGYAAISRLKITQTAPGDVGFAEPQVAFTPAPRSVDEAKVREVAHDIADPGLRTALERLARNVLSKK